MSDRFFIAMTVDMLAEKVGGEFSIVIKKPGDASSAVFELLRCCRT
jgi:hypothetical protein